MQFLRFSLPFDLMGSGSMIGIVPDEVRSLRAPSHSTRPAITPCDTMSAAPLPALFGAARYTMVRKRRCFPMQRGRSNDMRRLSGFWSVSWRSLYSHGLRRQQIRRYAHETHCRLYPRDDRRASLCRHREGILQGGESRHQPCPARGRTDVITQTATGNFDVGLGGLGVATFNALAKNIGITVVAPLHSETPPVTTPLVVSKKAYDSGQFARWRTSRARKSRSTPPVPRPSTGWRARSKRAA